jgi:alanyl aminopeptidase
MRLAIALACTLLACATQRGVPNATPAAAHGPPLLQLPGGVRPLRYALDLEVEPDRPGFRGTAAIDLELEQARTSIWMHGLDLAVSSVSVEVAGAPAVPADFAQVNADGVARVSFARPVGPGRATLRVAWEAGWSDGLQGLYRARSGGDAYASTQLEPDDARRVFPSFDEPRFKTPFEVTLTVPEGAVAVSNGPAVAEEPAGAGLRRVRFAATEPLPSYLVFVAVGPFDVVTPPPLPPNEVRGWPLPVRVLAPRGRGGDLAFAVEANAALVPWFERWFGIPHPYPKLDHVAVPEFAGGGMENAGAIAYAAERLVMTSRSSEAERRASGYLVAHEIAHMWFGDLVTLPWWTDVWLNEAFATWIGLKATEAWRPEWDLALEAFRRTDDLIASDSVAAARAIRQPLLRMADVEGQFDGLSYLKGAAVLASFERLAGPERFREGVRAYLRDHLHGTGTVEGLYAALSAAAGRDLSAAMAGFTDAPGVPLVSARVRCDRAGATLALAQSRWSPRGSEAPPGGPWRIPLCARWEADGGVQEGCTLLAEPEGALALGPACPAWVMPHAGATSYHRWTLDPADLARLVTAGLPRLSAAEKLSLARNLRAAQQAGTVPWGDAMGAIAALARDPDPRVAGEPATVLALVAERLVAPEDRPLVATFARRLYSPVLGRLGWDPRPGEDPATRQLRAAAVTVLALVGRDPEVRREAARRGAALGGLEGAAPRPDAAAPELAELLLACAVQEGGPAAFDALVARLRETSDPSLRPKLIGALATQQDPALAARAAALWRGPEVRSHELRYLLPALGDLAAGREALLAELERDLAGVAARLPAGRMTHLPGAMSRACDHALAGRVQRTFEPALVAHPEAVRPLARTLEQIRVCAAERDGDGAAIAAFFGGAAR